MTSLFPYYAALFSGIAIAIAGQVLLKLGSARTDDVAAQLFDVFTLLGLAAYGAAAHPCYFDCERDSADRRD